MFSTIWNNVIYYPILNLLIVFYDLLFDNLGLAIIVIAILIRLILIPLMKNQTEMTKKMSSLKPQLDELQKKYKNNPEKLSQEQIKLYKKVGYNPLGCLVTFIPQLIIFSVLIQVIRNVTTGDLNGIYPFVTNLLNDGASLTVDTKFLMWDLTKTFNDLSSEFGKFSIEALPYLGLSVLVGISQYFASKFTQVMQGTLPKKEEKKKKGEELSPEEMTKKMTKSFSLILPFTTIFIAISAPAALSLYWSVQSFMLVIQYMLLDWDKTEKGIQNLFTKLRKNEEKGKKSPK
ncbi:MAG TPA: YidC/Oxa1 family membrane protein insertase [Candidatus Dojkabacteria bacterium]|nr:YidC/Oxa1 family membrane protein insertase [Candidatus Dojkabacteria bacterium]